MDLQGVIIRKQFHAFRALVALLSGRGMGNTAFHSMYLKIIKVRKITTAGWANPVFLLAAPRGMHRRLTAHLSPSGCLFSGLHMNFRIPLVFWHIHAPSGKQCGCETIKPSPGLLRIVWTCDEACMSPLHLLHLCVAKSFHLIVKALVFSLKLFDMITEAQNFLMLFFSRFSLNLEI